MPALVISIDGPDFSGKSTISNLLIEFLRKGNKEKNIFFKRTEVPSTLTTGFFTKILRNSADSVDSKVFALAYAADHLHHYETIIKPLKESKENFVVIQERSLLTTYLYQAVIGGAEIKWVKEINKFNKNIPDLTLVLKLTLEEITKRSLLEKRDFDKFETAENLEKELKTYYNIPEELAREFNIELVNANEDAELVAEKCAKIVQKEIDERFK